MMMVMMMVMMVIMMVRMIMITILIIWMRIGLTLINLRIHLTAKCWNVIDFGLELAFQKPLWNISVQGNPLTNICQYNLKQTNDIEYLYFSDRNLRNGCFLTQKRNNFVENAPYFTPKAFEARKFDLPQLRYVGLWVSNKSNRSITSSRAPHHSKLLQKILSAGNEQRTFRGTFITTITQSTFKLFHLGLVVVKIRLINQK